MITKRNTIKKILSVTISIGIIFSNFLYNIPTVNAAALTALSDVMTSQKVSTLSNHTITFTTPSGVDAGETITVTFPAGFTIGSVDNTDIDVTDDGVDLTLSSSASGATWGAAFSSQVLTITSGTGTIAPGSVIVIEIGTNATTGATGDQRITNNSSASTYSISIAGTFGDTGSILIPIITDDQVSVTATVGQTVSFAISDNTIGFGNLSSSTARFATGDAVGADGPTKTSAHTMTIGTNAASGYTVTYNGATLTSGSNTINVATITGDENGTQGSEQFAISATRSGDATIASAYNGASNNSSFVASTTTTLVSETVASANETITMFYLANIATLTEAGSYSTAITYVATANY